MSQQINLFNPAFQPQKKIFSVNAMAGALGVLVLLVVGTGVYVKVRIAQLEARVARGEAEVQAAQKRLDHMPIFFGVAVDAGLVLKHRHQPLLGVLLLDQILAGRAADPAREEDLQTGVERAQLHRILRA